MIRTSKISIKYSNKEKKNKLNLFVEEYSKVVKHYVELLWNQLDDDYNCPKFISTKDYNDSNLSQRAIKCAATQACGVVKSNTEKVRKLKYIITKLNQEGKETSFLDKKLKNTKVSMPIVRLVNCELNSICCDLQTNGSKWFLQLKSIGKSFGKIRLHLSPHRQTLKWKNKGQVLSSFLISKDHVQARFEIKNELKNEGKIIGLDQGIASCITLSDGQVSSKDCHGHDLSSIMKKMSRKIKGSKAFKKCQDHRKNYINWSINQLNLKDVKQLNVEKISNIRFGKKVDRFRSHWTFTLIIDKLKRFCEEQKVSVLEQNCVYRSQRCSGCGLVFKGNRVGKTYRCKCGLKIDSDLNASLNHEVSLPEVYPLKHLQLNLVGFYWNPTGIFDLNGKELTVPSTIKT